MGDFPPPTRREKTAYRTADSAPEADDKKRLVVSRPEPPPEELSSPARDAKRSPDMTKEEIAALLAVTETNQLTRWARIGDRAKRAILPVGLLSTLLGVLLGTWASLVPIVIGIAYSAWPLVTQKKSGWV